MKIALINPSTKISLFPDGRPAHRKHCTPPLGLAYLAAQLQKSNHEVVAIDMLAEGYDNEVLGSDFISYGMSTEDLIQKLDRANPDLIGISVMFSNIAEHVYEICKQVKKALPGISILLGGQHVTGMPLRVMENKCIDYLLLGEAESNLVTLCDCLRNGKSLGSVPSLVYRENGVVINNQTRHEPKVKGIDFAYFSKKQLNLPNELDSLSYPAWDLFPLNAYWKSAVRLGSGDIFEEKYLVTVTSRGCPHVCDFCTSPLQSGWRGYRVRSVQNLVDEIHFMRGRYGISEMMFNDDNFFVAKPRVKQILSVLGSEFPSMTFSVPGGTEVNALDDDVIELLAKANFKKLTLNIESPDQDIQDLRIDKKVKVKEVRGKALRLREFGIETRAMIMMGFPGQSRKSILDTIAFAKDLPVDDFMLSIVSPLPGTPLFDEVQSANLFVDNFNVDKIAYALSAIRLPEVTPEELEEMRHTAWSEAFELRRANAPVTTKFRKYDDIRSYERGGYKLLG